MRLKIFKVLLIVFFACPSLFAQSTKYKFDRLLIRDGLSQSSVFSIVQDYLGFMWIGTLDGLNRFDGYNFEVFRPIPGDSNSISHNSIFTILEDSKHNIWVGTLGGGLNKYDRNSNSFTHFLASDKKGSISNNNVRSIFEDSDGNIWVGTDDGLNRLVDKNNFKTYRLDPNDSSSISNNTIWDIEQDSNGNLYIGTYAGLNIMDKTDGKFKKIINIPGDPNSLSHDYVWDINLLNDSLALIATDNGFSKLNLLTEKFTRYAIKRNGKSLLNFKAWEILADNNNIWVGTLGNGLAQFSINNTGEIEHINHYTNSPKNETSISQNYIWSLTKDKSGLIWIGTDLGLNRTSIQKGKFIHIKSDPYEKNTLSSNEVTSIIADKNDVWIGTRDGLNKFNSIENTIKNMKSGIAKIPLSNEYIRALLKDKNGYLWIGTDCGGLTKYD